MKRIFLSLAINLAIALVLFVTLHPVSVESRLNANGLNLPSLLIFAAIMGFGGSFISLATSRWSARKAMVVPII